MLFRAGRRSALPSQPDKTTNLFIIDNHNTDKSIHLATIKNLALKSLNIGLSNSFSKTVIQGLNNNWYASFS